MLYEDVFNNKVLCKFSDGAVVECPLFKHEDQPCLCYSPCAGLILQSQVPAAFADMDKTVMKKPVCKKTLFQQNPKEGSPG